METSQKFAVKQIVPVGSQALTVRSAALVARGLRDLARDSNWLIKKVFSGRTAHLAISSSGQVCAISPPERNGTQRTVLYDIERSVPTLALAAPNERVVPQGQSQAAFAWSADGSRIVVARAEWKPALHLFDLHGKMLLGTFGAFESFPETLAWSATGKYLMAAASGRRGMLRLWEAGARAMPFQESPAHELAAPDSIEPQTYNAEPGDEGGFGGYGRAAFSPDEKAVASVVAIEGDWADDSIVIANVPSMQRQIFHQAQGHVTDIAWASGSQQLVYCSAGQAYRLDIETMSTDALPFGAELCVCHPNLPLCLCFSSWLKNSARGRLFIVDLNRLTICDERPAEDIADLCWSIDGSKAYAVTHDGMGYIYDPPLI
ncbi:MAG: WD40 repeat domain-containing protein [Candidatus Acidiferrales bacterium]